MSSDATSVRSDVLSLAEFVADARAVRSQAWESVERLKLACALEAVWIPMLQFEQRDPSIAQTLQDVRSELGTSIDDSQLATWLASPNVWLHSRAPVDLLGSDMPSVLVAARTDRFLLERTNADLIRPFTRTREQGTPRRSLRHARPASRRHSTPMTSNTRMTMTIAPRPPLGP